MRLIVLSIALIGALTLGILLMLPRSSHGQEPTRISIALVGQMPQGPGYIDTKILCDSRGNEFVVVKNEGGGSFTGNNTTSIAAASVPGGCK